MRNLPAISIYGYVGGRQLSVRVGVENFFWVYQFFSSMKLVGATGLDGLWAFDRY